MTANDAMLVVFAVVALVCLTRCGMLDLDLKVANYKIDLYKQRLEEECKLNAAIKEAWVSLQKKVQDDIERKMMYGSGSAPHWNTGCGTW